MDKQQELSILHNQILQLLPKEKQVMHEVYTEVIRDYSYLWEMFPDLLKLRSIILLIVRLFVEEHEHLQDIGSIDKAQFKKSFKSLISDYNALSQV